MELLVRVRWRHVPAADLRIEIEPYHTVGDLLGAASDFCDGNWDASQPLYLERSGDQVPLDVPIIESGIVSGDTLRFELYGVDPLDRESLSEAVSCDVTAGPEAGRSFVLLPGRHEVGRATGAAVRLDDVTVSDHQLSIIVYDDLVTRLVPDPSATNPVVVNGHPISEATLVGPNDVVQFGATAVALRVFSRTSDSERDQLGQVPFRRTPYKPVVVQKREFKPIGNVPTKPEPRRFSLITTLSAVGRRPGDVRDVPLADVPDDVPAVAVVDGRPVAGQPEDRDAEVRRVDREVPRPAWTSARRRSSRRCSTSAPSGSTNHPTSPTSPAGRRCAPSTCGPASAATTSSCGPGWGSARWPRRSPSTRRRPVRSTCARRRRRSSPATTRFPPARSASTSPSSACSACTASSPTCGRCARRSSSRRSRCTAPRTSSSSSSRGSPRDSVRGPSGCRTPARRRRRSRRATSSRTRRPPPT